MSSSDWWTSSTSQLHTPQRPSSVPILNNRLLASGSTARFAGDELDPTDAEMADGINFIPSFASSPAGKMAMGMSMGMGMTGSPGGGVGSSGPGSGGISPPANRRSPTARFSFGERCVLVHTRLSISTLSHRALVLYLLSLASKLSLIPLELLPATCLGRR